MTDYGPTPISEAPMFDVWQRLVWWSTHQPGNESSSYLQLTPEDCRVIVGYRARLVLALESVMLEPRDDALYQAAFNDAIQDAIAIVRGDV